MRSSDEKMNKLGISGEHFRPFWGIRRFSQITQQLSRHHNTITSDLSETPLQQQHNFRMCCHQITGGFPSAHISLSPSNYIGRSECNWALAQSGWRSLGCISPVSADEAGAHRFPSTHLHQAQAEQSLLLLTQGEAEKSGLKKRKTALITINVSLNTAFPHTHRGKGAGKEEAFTVVLSGSRSQETEGMAVLSSPTAKALWITGQNTTAEV